MKERLWPKAALRARLCLVFVSVCVGVALAEVASRWVETPDRMVRFEYFDARIRESSHAQFMSLVQSDPELFWRLTPNVSLPDFEFPFFGVISNAQGLREDHDIALEKRPGEVRILFLGDSVTFGFKLSHADSFPEQVEERLQARFPGVAIECINAGVPGYTLVQGWRLLETRGLGYQPDLVVLNFGQNDQSSWPDGATDLEVYRARLAQQPPEGLRWLRLSHLLWKTLVPSHKAGGDPAARSVSRGRVPVDEFTPLLKKIRTMTQRQGVGLLVFVTPYREHVKRRSPTSPHQEAQYEFAKDLPLGHVDGVKIVRRLEARHRASDLFVDAGHPTALTNQHVAEAIFGKIEAWLAARIKESSSGPAED